MQVEQAGAANCPVDVPQRNLAEMPAWFHYGFLLLIAAVFYLNLFILPATPLYCNPKGDQWVYLHNATRMLHGQKIYRGFFQFTTPGTELVYLALFKIFGVRAWIPNAVAAVIGFLQSWLCINISRKILSGLTAYLPAVLFVVAAFDAWPDATHHLSSSLAVMVALALLVEKRTLHRIAVAAAFCAIATFFTQARGVVAVVGLMVFLWWENRNRHQSRRSLLKTEGIAAGVFAAVTVGLNSYFLWTVGWKRYLWSTVVFGSKYWPAEADFNSLRVYMTDIPFTGHWRGGQAIVCYLLIYVLAPLVYFLFFARFWRESKKRQDEHWDRLILVAVMGFFLFAGVAPAPSYSRLCRVAHPAFIIWAWFLGSSGKFTSLSRKVIWVVTLVLLVGRPLHKQVKESNYLCMPTGPVAFLSPEDYQPYKWVLLHTHPDDYVFDTSGEMYFLPGLRCPAEVQSVSPTDYVRPEQVENLISGLDSKQVRLVFWDQEAMRPKADVPPAADHLGPLRDYFQHNYHQAAEFEQRFLALERNE